VAKLSHLAWLEVAGGYLCDDGVAALCQMTQLTHLSIAQNHAITNRSYKHLCALKELRTLNISGTSMTGPSAAFLLEVPHLNAMSMHGISVCRGYDGIVIRAFPRVLFAGTSSM
jgi:hypothetical protein